MSLLSPPLATPDRGTPAMADSVHGVAFVPSRKFLGGPVHIDGAFQIPLDIANQLDRPVHRSLVLAVWSAGGYQDSLVPFRDVVLFPDDEIRIGALVRGAFSFDIDLFPGEGFYLHLALASYLSPSICCPP
jgi:hypothetical protein